MAGIRIRRAEEHRDWRALRMLLPQAVHYGCGCDVFVATDDDALRRVVGAVVVSPTMRLQPITGPAVALHVIEPWRRRGVGRALLSAAARLAAARGAKALYAWGHLPPGGEAAAAWRGVGFDQQVQCPLNRIDATRTVELLQPLFERLKERGRIPTEAHVVSLPEADLDEVVELATTYLAGTSRPDVLKDRLRGKHPIPFDKALSRVLLHRSRTVGIMLSHAVEDHVVWVEVNVVHPCERGRWANVWLKLDAALCYRELGYRTFVYETYQHHTDTQKLTSRLGGILVPRVELYGPIERFESS